jgi:hypothetical protein
VVGKDGKPARVHLTDGASIADPPEKDIKKVDFKAACKARYGPMPKKDDDKNGPDRDEVLRMMRQTALGALEADRLAT